ncbi:MAG: dihydropteroate synthase [Spirochaetes bacterium]|nr:dihydropteroate synthase [Spirochaetota bacterium]
MAFIRIGENLNVMSKVLGPAMKERNAKPIQEMAVRETEAGVDYIEVNIGPAKKAGAEMMEWLVKTIQEVTDTPLSLDTTNMEATEAGLKVAKNPPLINSVSLQTSRIDKGLQMAKQYDADFIALLWSDGGMPRDVNERAMHAVDFIQKVTDIGLSTDKMWIDPILSPISVEINQVKACVEFMGMLKDIAPGIKSTGGLSNVSNGVPDELRTYLNIPYVIMLIKNGLTSAIVDAFDKNLTEAVHGRNDSLVRLISKVADGEKVDTSSLSDLEIKYVKSAKVLMGEILFSNAWLEV